MDESSGGGGGVRDGELTGTGDTLLLDEDDSASHRFVVARNIGGGVISSNSSVVPANRKAPLSNIFPGRRKTQVTAETGQFVNRESESQNHKRLPKNSGMSDRRNHQPNIPERVAHFYYSLGLLCSSHPVLILVITTAVVALSW